MLHSHPSRRDPSDDNDEFSWGDGLVAAVSGKIYLTTPHGNVYALSQEDAKTVIDTGLDWDKTVFAQKKKPLLKALWYGLNPTDAFYYNVLADYDEHRKKAAQTLPGYNYETFDAKTYNTYK
ncbi:MAG: hypothetical protein IJO10_04095 [Clostridia bacterium]|nr:hypothetical protein [Clostridia bacterium]